MLKENKGITLVALVITIIVMLILAGVSISLVVGDNGVLTNATTAVDSNAIAEMKEDIEFAISSASSDCLVEYTTNRSANITDFITTTYMSSKGYYDAATSSSSINEGEYYVNITTPEAVAGSTNNEYTATLTVWDSSNEGSSTAAATATLTFTNKLYVSVKWAD